MTQQIVNQQAQAKKTDEQILVVKREHLFQGDAWHGIKQTDFAPYLELINTHKEFHWRSAMEIDPVYKQIIPYLIFNYQDQYFLMQRRADASATALQNKFSLGIGGHIRQEDMKNNSTIIDWAEREFHEEVEYTGNVTVEPLGILNDDSNLIGQVHIGFVFLLKGDSPEIKIKSEMKGGTLVSLDECTAFYNRMETWSQLVVDILQN